MQEIIRPNPELDSNEKKRDWKRKLVGVFYKDNPDRLANTARGLMNLGLVGFAMYAKLNQEELSGLASGMGFLGAAALTPDVGTDKMSFAQKFFAKLGIYGLAEVLGGFDASMSVYAAMAMAQGYLDARRDRSFLEQSTPPTQDVLEAAQVFDQEISIAEVHEVSQERQGFLNQRRDQ